jgi:hypothetical protein
VNWFPRAKKSQNLDTFINLILVACEDQSIKSQLLSILQLPWNLRIALLVGFIEKMKQEQAPADFVAAIEGLKKDEVARQVLELLKK